MLAAGDRVPPFETTDESGRPVRSGDLHGRPCVLFFYPKAGSWGCTCEAVGFANRYPEFAARGIVVLGISLDPAEAQRSFSARCQLPYPLLVDPSGNIARAFGVLGTFGFARRVTFLVGADGRVLRVVDSVLPGTHVRAALDLLEGPSPGKVA